MYVFFFIQVIITIHIMPTSFQLLSHVFWVSVWPEYYDSIYDIGNNETIDVVDTENDRQNRRIWSFLEMPHLHGVISPPPPTPLFFLPLLPKSPIDKKQSDWLCAVFMSDPERKDSLGKAVCSFLIITSEW